MTYTAEQTALIEQVIDNMNCRIELMEACTNNDYILAFANGLGIAFSKDGQPYACSLVDAEAIADDNTPEEAWAFTPIVKNGAGEQAAVVRRQMAIRNELPSLIAARNDLQQRIAAQGGVHLDPERVLLRDSVPGERGAHGKSQGPQGREERPVTMKAPYDIKEALDKTGLPYSVEPGKRHDKAYVAGRMVGVISKGMGHSQSDGDKGNLQIITAIRRRARQYHQENPQPSKETTPMTINKASSLSDLPHLVKPQPEQMRLPEPKPQPKPEPTDDNIGEVVKLLRAIFEQNTLILDALTKPSTEAREPREPRRVNSQALVLSILKARMKPGQHCHVTELHRILNESEEPKLVSPMKINEVYRHARTLWEAGELKQVRRAVYELVQEEA